MKYLRRFKVEDPRRQGRSDLFFFVVGGCVKEEAFSEVKLNMVLAEVSRRKSKIEDESSS